MKPHRCIAAAFAALLLGLVACSPGRDHAPSSTTQSRWLAVARGEVGIQNGRVLVMALTDGVVRSIAVKQGDQVKDGQALAQLDSRATKIGLASAQAGVAQAQAHLAELRVELRQAERRAPRIVAAARAGAASGDAAEQADDAVSSLAAKLAAAKAGLDTARQHLALARLRLDETTVRATSAGVVVARSIAIGQAVTALTGRPLFEILPDRPQIVRAQLDADAADSIHRGMHAEVVRDSGEGPAYPATVLWVGRVLQPASLTEDPLQRAIANDVDCVLMLDPVVGGRAKPRRLRIGQRVLVKFPRN